jgi:hypothetical protein
MKLPIPPFIPPDTRPAQAERVSSIVELEPKPGTSASPPARPEKLAVYFDGEAGRFVHSAIDADSEEILWRYPREAQLAYSRAVMAYLRALAGR